MSVSIGNAANCKVKLAKGDLVRIVSGKDRGRQGRVLKIDRARCRLLVEGTNLVKKTKKPQREGEQGDIIEVEAYLDISNAMILCPSCGPTRIGRLRAAGRGKERLCRKCGKVL